MPSNWWADQLAERLSEASGKPRPESTVPSGKPPAHVRPSTPRPPSSYQAEEQCPACYSGNYMSAPSSKYKRCYDCGYPVVQSGTGVSSTKNDAPTKPAVQVSSGGYSPTTIVGRIE